MRNILPGSLVTHKTNPDIKMVVIPYNDTNDFKCRLVVDSESYDFAVQELIFAGWELKKISDPEYVSISVGGLVKHRSNDKLSMFVLKAPDLDTFTCRWLFLKEAGQIEVREYDFTSFELALHKF